MENGLSIFNFEIDELVVMAGSERGKTGHSNCISAWWVSKT